MYNDVSLMCTNCAISNAVLKLGHFLCAKNRVKINESCLKVLLSSFFLNKLIHVSTYPDIK